MQASMMMVSMLLVKPQSTIAARMIAWLVQIDKHSWMSQWPSSTITWNPASLHSFGWYLTYQINGKTGVDLEKWKQFLPREYSKKKLKYLPI